MPSGDPFTPPSYVTYAPTSVPTYSVFGYEGSRMTEFTGRSGRLPLMLSKCLPPSVVLKTWPGRTEGDGSKPVYATYTIRVVAGVDRELRHRPLWELAGCPAGSSSGCCSSAHRANDTFLFLGPGVHGVAQPLRPIVRSVQLRGAVRRRARAALGPGPGGPGPSGRHQPGASGRCSSGKSEWVPRKKL